jgi:hypothetical protein
VSVIPVPSGLVGAQEAKKFDAFPQPPGHHLPTREHFPDDFPNLAGAEVKALVELFHAVKDLLFRQMRITDRRQLHALIVHQIDGIIFGKPTVVDGLFIECGARVRCGERDLDGVRIDFLCEIDGFLDGLRGLPRQAQDEGAMNQDAPS